MRTLMGPQSSCPADSGGGGVNNDFLALWRCGEAAAGNNFTDGTPAAARTLTQVNSPAVAYSLIGKTIAGGTTGARDFNGTTQYATRVSDSDETMFQGMRWGAAMWIDRDTAVTSILLEYGELPAGSTTNMQASLFVSSGGALVLQWQVGSNSNRSTSSATGLVGTGVQHIGVSVEPDPLVHDRMAVRLWLNGRCIHYARNLEPPTGGSASRWILGASWGNGGAGPNPALFFDGRIDDVVVCNFTPEWSFFRDLYAGGILDFELPNPTTQYYPPVGELYARIYAEIGVADSANADTLPWIPRINQTMVDLSTAFGFDPIKGLRLSRDADDQMWKAEFDIIPRFGFFNFSPLATAGAGTEPSAVGGNTSAAYSLLRAMRQVYIDLVPLPKGAEGTGQLGSDDLYSLGRLMFDGFIVNTAIDKDNGRVSLLDKGRALFRQWIEPNRDGAARQYGSGAGVAVQTEMQEIIDDNDPARFDILNIDDVGGATVDIDVLRTVTALGEGKPSAALSGDSVKVAGTVNYNGTYTLQSTGTDTTQMRTATAPGAFAAEIVGTVTMAPIHSYPGGKPTLWTPVSPAWSVYEWYAEPSSSVGAHLVRLAEQIGWSVAYRFDAVRRQFRLCFWDPAALFGSGGADADHVLETSGFAMSDDRVRNVGIIEYANQSSLDPMSDRQRFITAAVDTTSVRAWGRSVYRVAVGEESLITTSTEANRLNNAALADLKDPEATAKVDMLPLLVLEPSDTMYLLSEGYPGQGANHVPSIFTLLRYMAISGVEHIISRSQMRTRLSVSRFLPTPITTSIWRRARYDDEILDTDRANPAHGTGRIPQPATPTVTYLGTLNGTRTVHIKWAHPWPQRTTSDLARQLQATEVHASVSSGFTPSAATLAGIVGFGTEVVIASNTIWPVAGGGVERYIRLVHRDYMHNRSAVSAETALNY